MKVIFAFLCVYSSGTFADMVANSQPVAAAPSQPANLPTDDQIRACLSPSRQRRPEAPPNVPPSVPLPRPRRTPPSQTAFQRVDPSQISQLVPKGDIATFRKALQIQLAECQSHYSPEQLRETIRVGCRSLTRQQLCIDNNKKLLQIAKSSSSMSDLFTKAQGQFDWYALGKNVTDPIDFGKKTFHPGGVQFTGYYNPILVGSKDRTDEYPYPIYSTPDDLVLHEDPLTHHKERARLAPDGSYVPYYDRTEIDSGKVLAGKGLEIGYVHSLLDIYLFQVEGAGVFLRKNPDGTTTRLLLNYGASNGRESHLLASIMKCEGLPRADWATTNGIKDYFAQHPERLVPSLKFDPSYEFFKTSSKGPYGIGDTLLTDKHSVATDPRLVPFGAVALLDTPSGAGEYTAMAVAQDTGGAIKGAHVDIYFGEGDQAYKMAEGMNNRGTLFIPLPHDADPASCH